MQKTRRRVSDVMGIIVQRLRTLTSDPCSSLVTRHCFVGRGARI